MEFFNTRGDKHSLNALELFVVHCLGRDMLSGNFTLRHLERDTLIDQQCVDIHSQYRPISEHPDLLDQIVERHQGHPGLNLTTVSSQPQLATAITVEDEALRVANDGDDDDSFGVFGVPMNSTDYREFGPQPMQSVLPGVQPVYSVER